MSSPNKHTVIVLITALLINFAMPALAEIMQDHAEFAATFASPGESAATVSNAHDDCTANEQSTEPSQPECLCGENCAHHCLGHASNPSLLNRHLQLPIRGDHVFDIATRDTRKNAIVVPLLRPPIFL